MTLIIDNPTVELVLKPAEVNAALEMAALEIATGGAVNAPPYRVFTPFHRAWLKRPGREVLPAPRSLPDLPREVEQGKLPTLQDLGLEEAAEQAPRGGEDAGRGRMRRFLVEGIAGYGSGRDDLGADASSRLSP